MHREIEGARNRRCGEGEDVDLRTQCFQLLFLTHAESVFLIDDDKPEIPVAEIASKQLVRADEDVHASAFHAFGDAIDFLLRAEARDHLHADRPVGETVGEGLEVLLGKQGGRYEHCDLLPRCHGDKGCAHGNFGLAEPDVAANEAVHGATTGHVGQHGLDRLFLVRGFLEGELSGKGPVFMFRIAEGEAGASGAARMNVEQFCGDVADLFGRAAFCLVPLVRPQTVKRSHVLVGA